MIFEKLQVLILGPEDVRRNTCGGVLPKADRRTMYLADIVLYVDGRDQDQNRILKCRQAPLGGTDLALLEPPAPRARVEDDWDAPMFGPKPGTWSVESQSDPRWNKHGRSMMLVTTGPVPDAQAWIDECKKLYGEPPGDLAYSCMKD